MQKATKIILGVVAVAIGLGLYESSAHAAPGQQQPGGNKNPPGPQNTNPSGPIPGLPEFDPGVFTKAGLDNIGKQPVGAPFSGDPDGTVARVFDPASGNSVPVNEDGVALGYTQAGNSPIVQAGQAGAGLGSGLQNPGGGIHSGGASHGNFGEEPGGVGALNPFRRGPGLGIPNPFRT